MFEFIRKLFKRKPKVPEYVCGYGWAMSSYSDGNTVDAIYIQADSPCPTDFDRGAHDACVDLIKRGAHTELRQTITGERDE